MCFPVGVCPLPLCLVLSTRTDIFPEDGHTVTETCRRFYEILAF